MPLYTKLKIIWLAVFASLVAASLSKNTSSALGIGIDALFHVSIYSILSFIPLLLFRKRFTVFIVTITIPPLSFLFESIHGFISGYGFENFDAFYNNIGIIIGIIAGSVIRLKKHYEKEQNMTQ